MKNIYHRLLLLIAGSTQEELASQIRYLKIENEILRSKLALAQRKLITRQSQVRIPPAQLVSTKTKSADPRVNGSSLG